MPHPNADKGARWERWCSFFLSIKRTLSKGKHDDMGDLEDPDFVYECKDDASRSPMQWWLQAEAARNRAAKPWAIVLAKARMPKPGQPRGWAQMSIEQWRELRGYIAHLEIQCAAGGYDNDPVLLRRNILPPGELADDQVPVSRRQAS
jgi:hypothetical protein